MFVEKTFLICYMTLRDHLFNELFNFMGESHLPCFVDIFNFIFVLWTSYLICHITSQDREIKGSCDFIGGSFLICITTLPSVMTKEIVVVEICF